MPEQHINFTKKSIQALTLPQQGTCLYHDTLTRGLKLVVRPTGTKTFVLYRKICGKPERITIGRFPDITIEQARKQADTLNAQIAQGNNPNDTKRNLRSELTLSELFNQYLEQHAKPHKRSWKHDEHQFNRYLLPWKDRKISSITKQDIQKHHTYMGEKHGIYAANRLIALFHVLFNKAIEWGWKHPNPAHGIKKFKEISRERFLQTNELPLFFKALNEEPNEMVRDYFLVTLLTGARRSNVSSMRWDEINFEQAIWKIPETKNGSAHTVPLVDTLIELLKIRQEKNSGVWVFPSTGKTGHLVEPKKAWQRILQRAGIKNLRIHDLRRSMGSWQATTGASLLVIGKTLAHKSVSSTAIYARLNLDPVREAMNKAVDAMLKEGNMT